MALRTGESMQNGAVADADGRLILGGSFSSTAQTSAGTASVATTSGAVVATNAERREVTIVNDSDATIYLALGAAAEVGKGVRLNAAGGSYTTQAFTGTINGIHGGAGSKTVTYVEV